LRGPPKGPDHPAGEDAFAQEDRQQQVAILGLLGLQEKESRQPEAEERQQADGDADGVEHPVQAR
jgi:hypothetical protein